MSEQTKIQWADSTLNFWEGCTKVSDGCKNCYAEARDKRFTGGKLWGKGAPRRKSKSAVKDALAYNRKPWVCGNGHAGTSTAFCYEDGCASTDFHRRRIFSLSLGDWLDPEVPIEWLAEMLRTIHACQNVIWMLLTKRPELFHERMHDVWASRDTKDPAKGVALAWSNGSVAGTNDDGTPMFDVPKNVIVGTTAENHDTLECRYGELLAIPAAKRFLSCEPLLENLNLFNHGCRGCNHPGNILVSWNKDGRCSRCDGTGHEPPTGIDWVIVGGESGGNARPCNIEWITSIVRQCKDANVPVFVKQLGSNPRCDNGLNYYPLRKDKKGADPSEWPEDLRVQEWPKGF